MIHRVEQYEYYYEKLHKIVSNNCTRRIRFKYQSGIDTMSFGYIVSNDIQQIILRDIIWN